MKRIIMALMFCMSLFQLDALLLRQYKDKAKNFDTSTDLIRGWVLLNEGNLFEHRHFGNIDFYGMNEGINNPDTCSYEDKSNDAMTQLLIITHPSTGGSGLNASGTKSLGELFPHDLPKIVATMFKIANDTRKQVIRNHKKSFSGEELKNGIKIFEEIKKIADIENSETIKNAQEAFDEAQQKKNAAQKKKDEYIYHITNTMTVCRDKLIFLKERYLSQLNDKNPDKDILDKNVIDDSIQELSKVIEALEAKSPEVKISDDLISKLDTIDSSGADSVAVWVSWGCAAALIQIRNLIEEIKSIAANAVEHSRKIKELLQIEKNVKSELSSLKADLDYKKIKGLLKLYAEFAEHFGLKTSLEYDVIEELRTEFSLDKLNKADVGILRLEHDLNNNDNACENLDNKIRNSIQSIYKMYEKKYINEELNKIKEEQDNNSKKKLAQKFLANLKLGIVFLKGLIQLPNLEDSSQNDEFRTRYKKTVDEFCKNKGYGIAFFKKTYERLSKLFELGKSVAEAVLLERFDDDPKDDEKIKYTRPYFPEYTNDIICAYAWQVIREDELDKLAGYIHPVSGTYRSEITEHAYNAKMARHSVVPFEIGQSIITNDYASYKGELFQDCVETMLRQLFAVLFSTVKDSNGQLVYETKLEQGRIPSEQLMSFFTEKDMDGNIISKNINQLANDGSRDVRDAWAEICGGHQNEGIVYCEGDHNLESSWKNVIRLFCLLMKDYSAANDSEKCDDKAREKKLEAERLIGHINNGRLKIESADDIINIINVLLGIRSDVELIVEANILDIDKDDAFGPVFVLPKNGNEKDKANNKLEFSVQRGHSQLMNMKGTSEERIRPRNWNPLSFFSQQSGLEIIKQMYYRESMKNLDNEYPVNKLYRIMKNTEQGLENAPKGKKTIDYIDTLLLPTKYDRSYEKGISRFFTNDIENYQYLFNEDGDFYKKREYTFALSDLISYILKNLPHDKARLNKIMALRIQELKLISLLEREAHVGAELAYKKNLEELNKLQNEAINEFELSSKYSPVETWRFFKGFSVFDLYKKQKEFLSKYNSDIQLPTFLLVKLVSSVKYAAAFYSFDLIDILRLYTLTNDQWSEEDYEKIEDFFQKQNLMAASSYSIDIYNDWASLLDSDDPKTLRQKKILLPYTRLKQEQSDKIVKGINERNDEIKFHLEEVVPIILKVSDDLLDEFMWNHTELMDSVNGNQKKISCFINFILKHLEDARKKSQMDDIPDNRLKRICGIIGDAYIKAKKKITLPIANKLLRNNLDNEGVSKIISQIDWGNPPSYNELNEAFYDEPNKAIGTVLIETYGLEYFSNIRNARFVISAIDDMTEFADAVIKKGFSKEEFVKAIQYHPSEMKKNFLQKLLKEKPEIINWGKDNPKLNNELMSIK